VLNYILEAILAREGVQGHRDRIAYLRRLQEFDKRLWKSYRPETGQIIKASYQERGIQAAYLLRYFLPYSAQFAAILEELHRKRFLAFRDGSVRLCSFGCGPAPELIGLVQFLQLRSNSAPTIYACLSDRAINEWGYARAIGIEILERPQVRKPNLQIETQEYDFSRWRWWYGRNHQQARIAVSTADIVSFQNCFNEISPRWYRRVSSNILHLLEAMRSGTTMILSARLGYRQVAVLFSHLVKVARMRRLGDVLVNPDDELVIDAAPGADEFPEFLKKYVYSGDGSLHPTRWVRCRRVLLRRR
jgi:hypothetical protein